MYMYIYMCKYVYMYTPIYVYIFKYMHISLYVYLYMQSKNVYMQICIYVKMCTCIYVNVYLYACVNIYVCKYVCMYGWMDGWMYGCNVYLYTLYTCMIIYVHIHVMISIPWYPHFWWTLLGPSPGVRGQQGTRDHLAALSPQNYPQESWENGRKNWKIW